MASKTNQWLSNNYANSEIDLIDSMIVEAIQIKGISVWYIMRDMIDRDYLFGESPISEFKDYVDIEMYLKDVQDFDGNADVYTQMGLEAGTSMTLEVACSRFKEELKDYNITRPKEGDLIYIPFSQQLLEIKKVNNDENYYQLNKNYRYVLVTKLFNYSHEVLPVGLDDGIDDIRGNTVIVNDDEMTRTLGLVSSSFQQENSLLEEEAAKFKTFDPSNPFGI